MLRLTIMFPSSTAASSACGSRSSARIARLEREEERLSFRRSSWVSEKSAVSAALKTAEQLMRMTTAASSGVR